MWYGAIKSRLSKPPEIVGDTLVENTFSPQIPRSLGFAWKIVQSFTTMRFADDSTMLRWGGNGFTDFGSSSYAYTPTCLGLSPQRRRYRSVMLGNRGRIAPVGNASSGDRARTAKRNAETSFASSRGPC